ncbi:MAG: protein BatD [Fibrobacter sp.]|nr:protein BatD [Fibrobacter sp.]
MKRIFLICSIAALCAWANPYIDIDRGEKLQPGKVFDLKLVYPLQEIPANAEKLSIVPQNGFTFMGLDSADQTVRRTYDDPFEEMRAQMMGRRNTIRARVYTIKLKAPQKTGRINFGELAWIIDGQKHVLTNNYPLEIKRSFDDDALIASLKPSKTTIYEGEQIYLTLNFHVYEHFAGNIQPLDMSTGNDFIVHRNDLTSLEWSQVEGAPRERQTSAKFAWLSPTKSGNLQIAPFKFKYTKIGEPKVVTEQKSSGGFSMSFQSVKQENVDAETESKPIKITVKPLPEEGRPENFSGMVGNYSLKADVDKTNLKVGEALTLSLTLKGDGTPGTITDVKLPDFTDFRAVPPENNITKKISGPKVVTTKTTNIFLYPKKKGEFTIPEISYSWFNPAKKKYETATAGPWNILVEKGDAPTAQAIFNPQVPGANSAGGPPTVQKQEIEALGTDIRFIHKVGSTQDGKAPYKEIWLWIAFLAAIPAYFATVFLVKRNRKQNSDTALARRNQANKMLKTRFARANEALSKGDAKALYAALENGLIDYLSDLTNLEFRGMTRDQMKTELEKLGVKENIIESINGWLEKCAFARYAPVNPTSTEQSQMLKDVEKLCENLKI